MAKQKLKIANWNIYNKTLINQGNAYWKWQAAYKRSSVPKMAMFKQLFGGHLTLRDYDAQVGLVRL